MNFFKNNFKNNANLTKSKDTLIKNMTKFVIPTNIIN